MAWDRATVAAALVATLGPAVGVKVHDRPPEVLNPPCLVIGRPVTVVYGTGALGADTATLPVVVVGGIETEDQIEGLKSAARAALEADQTLGGAVQGVWPSEERNWLNRTGAGGLQLLTVELILEVMA
jgi:uncharacterized protein DUF3168